MTPGLFEGIAKNGLTDESRKEVSINYFGRGVDLRQRKFEQTGEKVYLYP
jgi:hypothetical protein